MTAAVTVVYAQSPSLTATLSASGGADANGDYTLKFTVRYRNK